MGRFSSETEHLLRKAGWYEGRSVHKLVESWQAELETPGGFTLSPVARLVLNEFGGLHIWSAGTGIACARSDIELNPLLAIGEEDRFFTYFQCLKGKLLFPLGEAVVGHCYISTDNDGHIYLVMDSVHHVAASFEDALENLLLGKGTTLLEELTA